MDNYLGSNIRYLRKKKGLNQTELGDLFNKKNNTVGAWETGLANPDVETLIKISNLFDISLDDLVNHPVEDVHLIKSSKKKENVHLNVHPIVHPIERTEDTHGIPLYPIEAIAGSLGEDISVHESEVEGYYHIPEFKTAGIEFMVRVRGASMYPKYSSGDIVGCRKINDLAFFQWGKVYVLDTDQGPLIKRLYPHENKDFIICHSDNLEAYPRFDIPRSSIRNIYIAIGVIRLE